MANYCIFCGEEIPEYKMVCGPCGAIVESLPPDRAKKLQKVLENEEARKYYQASMKEVKRQMMIALEPVANAIIAFIDSVLAVTEESEDG